jgi:hypothetical protein
MLSFMHMGCDVPCPELFWEKFMAVFGEALGFSLGVLPAALAFWGGFYSLIRWHDRRDTRDRRREDLTRRIDALERRATERSGRRAG